MNSCAASSNTCSRAASIRCVTLGCGIPRNAATPPGEANAATPGDTEVRSAAGLRRAADHAIRAAATIDRAADLPVLSGAADLHPHAYTAAGHGAVITTSASAVDLWSRCRVIAPAMEICCQ
jgi:hypothetical protein